MLRVNLERFLCCRWKPLVGSQIVFIQFTFTGLKQREKLQKTFQRTDVVHGRLGLDPTHLWVCLVLVEASSQIEEDAIMIPVQELQLQQLQAELDLLKSDLELRMELSSELQAQVQTWEKRFQGAEEEKLGAIHELGVTLEKQKDVVKQVRNIIFRIKHSLQNRTGPNGRF